MKSAAILALCSVAALTLGGCASFRNAAPGDPLEPVNRGIFSFNSTFDHYLFKPIAKGYDAAVKASDKAVAAGEKAIAAKTAEIEALSAN